MKTNWRNLLLSLAFCLAAGMAGALFTVQSVGWWYPLLRKPAFTPPAFLFGPIWTMLYVLMGVSLYLVWNKGLKKKMSADATAFFGVQLVLNVVWPYFFFGLRSPLLALVEILVLWAVVGLTYVGFRRVSALAGWLLLPYFVWTGFAAILNLGIVLLN